jgi:hypothetical protein
MNKRLIIYIACILLLEWFCIINAHVIDLKGASVDANKFQEAAINWTQFGSFRFVVSAEFYSQLLGLVYLLFGKFEFVGAQLSVMALVIGAIYFERILKIFRIERTHYWIVPFLLWPSLITRATTTMREPILICLTIAIVFHLLLFQQNKRHLNAVYAIGFCFCAALIHKAYAVVAIVVVPYILFFVMKQQDQFYRSGVFYLRISLAIGFLAFLWIVYRDLGNVRGLEPVIAMMSGDVDYMQAVVDSKTTKVARATYTVGLDFTSVSSIVTSYPLVFIYYIFSPFPWMIASVYDAYAALEGIFRLVSFICLFVSYRNSVMDRKNLSIVFAILIALLMVWAAGTVNYGTASRHHTTTIWFFLLFIALVMRKESVTDCRLLGNV